MFMKKYAALVFLIWGWGNSSQASKCQEKLNFNNPSQKSEETRLKEKGFTPDQYKGVDNIHRTLSLGLALREDLGEHNTDPQNTPTEILVPLVSSHLEHIKKGFENPELKFSRKERTRYYNSLEKEALVRIQMKQVTYRWWLLFNVRASYLLSLNERSFNHRHNRWPTHEHLEADLKGEKKENHGKLKVSLKTTETIKEPDPLKERLTERELLETFNTPQVMIEKEEDVLALLRSILEKFPEKIVLPIIFESSVLALNKIPNGDQIVPVGLTNRLTDFDGFLASFPFDFLIHDLDHIASGLGNSLFPRPKNSHKNFMLKLESVSPQERLKAEAIYFILTHEVDPETNRDLIHPPKYAQERFHEIAGLISDESIDALSIFASLDLIQKPSENASDAQNSKHLKDFEKLLQESINIFYQILRNTE